jgi:hypothetical protein
MKDLKGSKFFLPGKPVSRFRRMTRSRARRAAFSTVSTSRSETSELLAEIEAEEMITFSEVLSAAIHSGNGGGSRYETDPEGCIELIEKWSADSSGYDEKNWPEIQEGLKRNRD